MAVRSGVMKRLVPFLAAPRPFVWPSTPAGEWPAAVGGCGSGAHIAIYWDVRPIRSAPKVNERMPFGQCCLHDEHLHVTATWAAAGELVDRHGALRAIAQNPTPSSCLRPIVAVPAARGTARLPTTTARPPPPRLFSPRHVARCGGDAGVRAWGASRALLRHVTHRPPAGGARRHRSSRRQCPPCHCRSIRGRPEGCSPCICASSRRSSCGEGVHVSCHGKSRSIAGSRLLHSRQLPQVP